MTYSSTDAAESVDKGHVFQRFNGWKTSGAGVDGGGACERSAEVLKVSRPRVGGIWIKNAFEMGNPVLVATVLTIRVQDSGVEACDVFGFEMNDAPYGIGSGIKRTEIAFDPVRGHGGVGVGGEDRCARTMLEAMKGGVHQHATSGTDVSDIGRQGMLGAMEVKGGMLALVLADDGCRGICAVIQEDDNLVQVVRERGRSLVDLLMQSI